MKQKTNEKLKEIVTKQINYCEENLKEPNCDAEFLTNQLNLRQQLLKTFENHQTEVVQYTTPTKEALEFCKMQGDMFQFYLAKLYDHIKETKEDYDWKELIEAHALESIRIVEDYLCRNYVLCD